MTETFLFNVDHHILTRWVNDDESMLHKCGLVIRPNFYQTIFLLQNNF